MTIFGATSDKNVIILILSLVAPKFVNLTTFCATNNENVSQNVTTSISLYVQIKIADVCEISANLSHSSCDKGFYSITFLAQRN